MKYKHILLLSSFLLLINCSAEVDPRKSVINFKVSGAEFDNVETFMQLIAKARNMQLVDSSYQYGTSESPQTRLIIELNDSNNLLIYTDCYSDWEKCFMEFLCYKNCPGWIETTDSILNMIPEKWEILNVYRQENGSGKNT